MKIRCLQSGDHSEWLRMRKALWPDCPAQRHENEMATIIADHQRQVVFVAEQDAGMLCGFVEASIHPHAIGCETNPVGYVEGWWVDPAHRRGGVGRALLCAVESWVLERGCTEIASDCMVHNEISLTAHLAAGYRETGRLIHFAKRIV